MDENIVAQSKRWVVRQVISNELKVNSKETIGLDIAMQRKNGTTKLSHCQRVHGCKTAIHKTLQDKQLWNPFEIEKKECLKPNVFP